MARQPSNILLAEPFDPSAVKRLAPLGKITVLERCDEQALAEAIRTCDALLVRSGTRVTRELLERANQLKVIGRAGVGLDNIDVAAAAARGVQVVYTPDASTDAVADLTVGLMISLIRRVCASDAAVRAGRVDAARAAGSGRELADLTLGIIGLGRIGRAVARRCRHGFATRIVYNDIVSPGLLDFAATAMQKHELYQTADVISLHVPLTAQTRGLIGAQTLRDFKRGAYLINTARGEVVDTGALVEALTSNRLGGAALDVTDPEPLPLGHALLSAPNLLLIPHIGARTHGALARMNDVVDDVAAVLRGKRPRHPAPAVSSA